MPGPLLFETCQMKPKDVTELLGEIRIHWSSLKGLLLVLFMRNSGGIAR